MNQKCVRCHQSHPYGHRDPTSNGWWYCEECWLKSVGYQRLCNSCKRHSTQGIVSYVDQYWYCNDCWERRDNTVYSPGRALPPLPPLKALPPPVSSSRYDRYSRYMTHRRDEYEESSSDDDDDERPYPPRKKSRRQSVQMHKEQAQATTEPTTLMLRNLPRTLTRDMLLDLLRNEGFGVQVNFIYVPMNFQAGENFGYGFINLTTFQEAEKCRTQLSGFDDWPVPWDKACDVSNGDTCQGVEAHVERYRNSPVMHDSVPECHKPAIFRNGVRVEFPKPTKQLKKPHIRPRKQKGPKAAPEAKAASAD